MTMTLVLCVNGVDDGTKGDLLVRRRIGGHDCRLCNGDELSEVVLIRTS